MNPIYNRISSFAMKALLYEVSATPKPGLVDRVGSGAHRDMDYFTFIDSTVSLHGTFYACTETGANFCGEPKELLKLLRPIGIDGEREMLKVTKGVNTHKGAIFSLGIICAAAGHLLTESHTTEDLCSYVKKMTVELVQELKNNLSQTAGERLYHNFGVLGIRGEVSLGFPSVRKFGLPIMRKIHSEGILSKNEMLIEILIRLLAHVTDSNVLSRAGLKGLELVQSSAEKSIALGGVYTQEGWYSIVAMDQLFIDENISPGGAADLLAVTAMLYFLETEL